MGIPTHEDAKMIVELFRLRLEPFVQEAETWFNTQFAPDSWENLKVKYPNGSRERRMLMTVLGYWEMIGAFLDHNILSEDVLFDTMESLEMTWEKVQEWLPSARTELGSDYWENIEMLVRRQQRWRYTRTPKAERI